MPLLSPYVPENHFAGRLLESNNPLAYALSRRILTALGVYKRFHERIPDFKRQLDHALRCHCKEGDEKWVSLLLWAGADPYAGGECDPEYSHVGEDDACAIEYAISFRHPEILRMKNMPHDLMRPKAFKCLESACEAKSAAYAECLLKLGYPVNDREDGTSSLIASIYSRVPNYYTHIPPGDGHGWIINRHVDASAVAEKARILELILKRGARWRPVDKNEFQGMRKAMNKMDSGATFDFVKLLVKHKACERAALDELFRPESLRVHCWKHIGAIYDVMERLPD